MMVAAVDTANLADWKMAAGGQDIAEISMVDGAVEETVIMLTLRGVLIVVLVGRKKIFFHIELFPSTDGNIQVRARGHWTIWTVSVEGENWRGGMEEVA